MTKNKFIIIYTDCLRSKIIYQKFIEKNYKNIKYIIEVPALGENRKKLLLNILKSSYSYILFTFLQFNFYNLLRFSFSDLKKLAKKKKINYVRLKFFPKIIQIKEIVKNFKYNDIILSSTYHILNENFIKSKNVILNCHEAPLPKYRGSALYFHLKINEEKHMYTSIIQPSKFLDNGSIVLKSKKNCIKNLSVFQIALVGYFLQGDLIMKLINKKIKKKIVNQDSKHKIYSFPKKKEVQKLRLNEILRYKDLLIIIKLFYMSTRKSKLELEKYIKNKLNTYY